MRSLNHTYVLDTKEYYAGADITNKGEFFAAVGINDKMLEMHSYAELEMLYKAITALINNINNNTED